jgi:molybdate transport system substrate-binding protein
MTAALPLFHCLLASLLAGLMLAAAPRAFAADQPILVFAAASLKNALDDADAAYERRTGVKVAASYAASGTLAKQLESGAPADLFISADLDWMDYVEARHLIRPDSRSNLLGNTLVLVAPAASTVEAVLAPGSHLAPLLGDGRLAVGDPQSVPAGKYAEAALTQLGIWPEVKDRLASAESVRAALAYVSLKEAPLGIVYGTDAAADKGVRVVATFPASSYPAIVYPAALTTSGTAAGAAAFLTWLKSPEAAAYFTKQGFTVSP